ncbi:unnamed protein product [Pleuronectes platessa]|uniref:Uncharacterized protein n=1 Tax=Pleuronectes platessa TaxID=8262 RepID=A0A9N7TNZ5_PLEPL|nr:unnamed protein product [Pleuronectes platessa]
MPPHNADTGEDAYGDLAEKQSLRSGSSRLTDLPTDRGALTVRVAAGVGGRRLLGGGLDPGCTRAAHCEAGGAPADFTHLTAGHVSPAQGSPRLQAHHELLISAAQSHSWSCLLLPVSSPFGPEASTFSFSLLTITSLLLLLVDHHLAAPSCLRLLVQAPGADLLP